MLSRTGALPDPLQQRKLPQRTGTDRPPGTVDEIFVGAVGVGRGYLNQPELPAKREKLLRRPERRVSDIVLQHSNELSRI